MNRKIGITVTAMLLAVHLGSPLAAEQPTTEQLSQIAAYLAGNDVSALRSYLLAHPDLLEEQSPLAGLLREFMTDSENLSGFVGFGSGLRRAVDPNRSDSDANRDTTPDSFGASSNILY